MIIFTLNPSVMNRSIVRIEHPSQGKGLWTTRNAYDEALYHQFSFVDDLVVKHRAFPTPWEEGLFSIGTHDFCAFKSIEQLQLWIDKEWWEEIFELGFKVYIIDVSEYQEGTHQILFQKQHVLQTKDISDLFK
jgi:hypothetical protein